MIFDRACGIIAALAALCGLVAGARKTWRWLRFRKGRVPADGAPLTHAEKVALVTIVLGWKRQAAEPVYDHEGER